jgi:hypothetical protein
MTPDDLLSYILGDPKTVALYIPSSARSGPKDPPWSPSAVQPGELPGLIAQHLAGRIADRIAVRIAGKQWMERRATALGAYDTYADEIGGRWCRWMAIDIDVKGDRHAGGLTGEDGDAAAWAAWDLMEQAGLCPFLERSSSGRGWHVWSLFDEPVGAPFTAWLVRLIADGAAAAAGITAELEGFPKSGAPKTLGTQIALPLRGQPTAPTGGQLFRQDGSRMAVEEVKIASLLDLGDYLPEWRDCVRAERLEKERRMTVWAPRASDELAQANCEQVMHTLAPGRITEATDLELKCDCPRHASESRKSMIVSRTGKGWWCWRCQEGGHARSLIWWILGEGATGDAFDAATAKVVAA